MKKTDKSVSTTSRLQKLQVSRIKVVLFLSQIAVLIIFILGFCYVHDSAYTGNNNPFVLWGMLDRKLEFINRWPDALPTVNYVIHDGQRAALIINATTIFYITIIGFLLHGVINSIIAELSKSFAKTQIQKQLEPLYNLAKTAQKLSDESSKNNINQSNNGGADFQRMHNLESAIDSIKPESPNARLYTGDKDLKGLEDAINSLLNRTRESYSQQIRFVSDASHELRTPIAVVKGYTDMLDRWGKSDEKILDESISAIKTETEHMNKLVEQLLFLARGDSGRTKFNPEPFSLTEMVREVYEESVMIDCAHKWKLIANEDVLAEGDVAMLKQAIRILVDNAAKYTPEGETVTLKAVKDENDVPTVVVQDNGIGIAGQDMSHIFDRFYRSDPARGRQQGGTGLGLSIAKWIVDRHNGYFEVLSREEFGTRISIHLPKPQTKAI